MSKAKVTIILETWEDVERFLNELGVLQARTKTAEGLYTERLKQIEDALSQATADDQAREKIIFAALEKFVRKHQKELDGRSRKLTSGVVGLRTTPPAAKPKKGHKWADVVAALRAKKLDQLLTFKEPEPNKEAIKKFAGDNADVFAELPVEVVQTEEFYAEPTVATAPSE